MPGFRRVQLRGSDELFRPTEEQRGAESQKEPAAVHAVPAIPEAELRSLRLTVEELEVLADAVQHLKFPGKALVRPSLGDFERLEALRQKLLGTL